MIISNIQSCTNCLPETYLLWIRWERLVSSAAVQTAVYCVWTV